VEHLSDAAVLTVGGAITVYIGVSHAMCQAIDAIA
jgi:hypothetical protein